MVLECYTWMVHLFKKLKSGPDDDLTLVKVNKEKGDFGKQVPAEVNDEFNSSTDHVLRFKVQLPSMTVVKVEVKVDLSPIGAFPRQIDQIFNKWHGANLDRRRLIIRYSLYDIRDRFYITDGKSEKQCKGLCRAMNVVELVSFCNGLLFLSSPFCKVTPYFLYDPVLNKITTTISSRSPEGYPCALFFHPVAKEYRILTVQKKRAHYFEYRLYLFGSKTWRRTAKPSFFSRPRDNIHSCGKKVVNGNPAIVNGAVHWYKKGGRILTFDMIREEFCFKTLPFEEIYGGKGFCLPDVLVKEEEDRLCCCYMGSPEPVMYVWVLEDYAKWSWTRKYVVNLDWDTIKFPFSKIVLIRPHILVDVLVVSIHKDELVLYWSGRGMFSYHLGTNAVEKFKLRKSELDEVPLSLGFMGCTANC